MSIVSLATKRDEVSLISRNRCREVQLNRTVIQNWSVYNFKLLPVCQSKTKMRKLTKTDRLRRARSSATDNIDLPLGRV